MICSFLKQNDSSTLLIFFNGWGMDTTRLQAWQVDGCDVLAVHDYTVLTELPSCIARYSAIHVVAWSLGVWAAHQVLTQMSQVQPQVFKTRLAVNGTLAPISSDAGIPAAVFHGTGAHWLDSAARAKFNVRMSGCATTNVRRLPEAQQQELFALEQQIQAADPVVSCWFTRAIIGTRDRIFLPEAQRTAWLRWPQVKVEERPWMHDAFGAVQSWNEVLQ